MKTGKDLLEEINQESIDAKDKAFKIQIKFVMNVVEFTKKGKESIDGILNKQVAKLEKYKTMTSEDFFNEVGCKSDGCV